MNNMHNEQDRSCYPITNDVDGDFSFRVDEDVVNKEVVTVSKHVSNGNTVTSKNYECYKDVQTINSAVNEDASDYMTNENVLTVNYDPEFEVADKEMGELLDPKLDYIFKILFSNPNNIDILRNFLNSILDIGVDELETVILVNPQYDKTYNDEKMTIFDIKATTKTGVIYDIELQRTKVDMMAERIIFYTSRMIHEQLQRGDDYGKIKRAVTIVIADFDFIHDKDHYHGRYQYHDPKNNSTLSDVTEIHILELNKVKDVRDGKLWDWMKFFKSETREEFKMLTENNKDLEPAVDELEKLSKDRAARFAAWREEKEWRDKQAIKSAAIKDGLEEGRAKGLEEGRAEGLEEGRKQSKFDVAKALKENGADMDLIIKSTGFSREQIEAM